MNTVVSSPNLPAAATAGARSELRVEGMTCNNCARKVTTALQAVPGVHSVWVNVETCRASVQWSVRAAPDVPQLLAATSVAGFSSRPLEAGGAGEAGATASWHVNLWLGGGVTLLLMLGEWVFHLGMTGWSAWVAFALATVVQIYCGASFYRGAWRQLRVGSSNMDTLVALGSTTAFAYSAWALVTGAGGHLYFMEAAAIITLISIGHWIEARVGARASDALRALLQLAPGTARRLHVPAPATPGKLNPADLLTFRPVVAASPVEQEVPVGELRAGDLVVLRPGDQVPVDGEVTEGSSAVNEAMLTGESLPVEKQAGAKVYAGTANVNGRLVMRVTATGEATALASIIAVVQRAQNSRADIQRLGDRVSNVFVPVVVTLALAVGLAWGLAPGFMLGLFERVAPYLWSVTPPAGAGAGFIIAAAVLIVACPCAMGLATPAAIMASANAAARRGILIRDGVALEKAGRITAIVFDKTGTLTTGELAMAGPWTPTDSREQAHLVQELAGQLAQPSRHPVAKVLATFARGRIRLENWTEIPGAGVQAQLNAFDHAADRVRLGSLRWLEECGVNIPEAPGFAGPHQAEGAALVGLARGNDLLGMFALKDALKPGTARVVAQLQQQGLKTYLLTGDTPATAAGLARQIGIAAAQVRAGVRPDQKAEFIQQLQAQGERVAFVGDGINDAPALTQADLGIAVSRASDVAREAADLILLKSEITAVPEALGLARATLRTIKQNLFWAFFYNAAAVPLAALGFMSPVLCAAAMGLSDLVVIGNALRLRCWRG
jgi:Cu+-exporting ATPase